MNKVGPASSLLFEKERNVLRLIYAIRNSFPQSVEVYTKGSCYQFFKILQAVFPEAEAYYDCDHVITKIDGQFYDITGRVKKEKHLPDDGTYEARLGHLVWSP